jgi:hypothetical protein
MSLHSNASGIELHEDKRIKQSVRVASTANITISSPGTTIDGVTMISGDRVLVKNQSTGSENGIYVWSGSASAMSRAPDAASSTDFVYGFKVFVTEGTVNNKTYWTFTTVGTITVGSTSLVFSQDAVTGGVVTGTTGTFSSEVQATDFKATGLTGATQASRYVGATTTGAPASGTFVTGDYVEDRTSGSFWVCTSGGTPGTWVSAGFANPMTTQGDIIYGGTSGTPTRLAGGTSSYVLTSNGSTSAPSWQASTGGSGGGGSGGTGGSIVPIQTQTLTGSVPSVLFTVPSGFKNLFLTYTARGDSTGNSRIACQFNGDTGANYDFVEDDTSGANASTSQTYISFSYIANSAHTTGVATSGRLSILDHANTSNWKNATNFSRVQSVGASGNRTDFSSGTWKSTAAITNLTLIPLVSSNFVSGSTFTLWGESDAAPLLLTSNSNLIQETILTAATASLSISNIPQGYRDLRFVLSGVRSDAAATEVGLLLRFNGDSGGNYDWTRISNSNTSVTGAESAAATSIQTFGSTSGITGNSATSGAATGISGTLHDFTGTTFWKTCDLFVSESIGSGAGNRRVETVSGIWRSTSAITSMQFALSSGNFMAGAALRVYGEPASAAGPSVGTGTRLRISANQSITTATATAVLWDTEDADADNQHYTSAANLTGTVSKTAASATLTGSGTAFLTELSVGQVIAVPGTATEQAVVIAIASNTSLTVAAAFANSASGQTAARLNSPVVFRQPGMWSIEVGAYFAAISSGTVTVQVRLNGTTMIGQTDKTGINASAGYDLVVQRQFQQWDYIEVIVTQASGGSVNLTADERTHLAVQSRPTVIAAIPYVNIQDQKAQNTGGGTFTSGADQTRTLNTIVSDTAGVVSLTSNQFTLPPGTYRIHAAVPAYSVNQNQAWLFNVTDSVVVQRGNGTFSGVSTAQSYSFIATRFTISASKAFEIRHRCQTTGSGNGFGVAANFGTEVYTTVELWKEG